MISQANTYPRPAGVPAWSASTVAAGTACQPSHVKFNKGVASGTGPSDMGSYVRFVLGGVGAAVTESLNGTYKAMQSSSPPSITLDVNDIIANDPQGINGWLLWHAASMGAGWAMGVASNGANTGTAMQQLRDPISSFAEFTPGQACRLQQFDLATGGSTEYRRSFAPTGTACPE
jgi:hypothetical protein